MDSSTGERIVAMDEERRVVWFEDVGQEDISLVGAKGAKLGEMTKAHIPVPRVLSLLLKAISIS